MKTVLLKSILSFLLMAACYGNAFADGLDSLKQFSTYEQSNIAFTDVTLIDGSGEPVKYHQTIVIADGQFIAVGDTKSTKIPKSFKQISLQGKTIVPGLVGVHNHLHLPGHSYSGSLMAKLYLSAGVTTIQTAGSAFPKQELQLAKAIEANKKIGPEIIPSAPYWDGPNGNPVMLRLEDKNKIRNVVRDWASKGVRWFKVYRHIQPEQLKTIIAEAHKQGSLVTGHLCSVTFTEAVEMGIDGIQHGLNSTSDFRGGKQYGQCNGERSYMDELVISSDKVKQLQQRMVDSDTFLTSTLSIYESSISHRSLADERSLALMSDAMKTRYWKSKSGLHKKIVKDPKREKRLKRIMAFEYQFYKMGGLLAAGVDAGRFVLPGFGDQRNYELFIEAGFTSEEAIRIMTSNGARVLKRNDIGEVKKGKRADFIILDGNLKKNRSVIKNVVYVFKRGQAYDANNIIQSLKGKIGSG